MQEKHSLFFYNVKYASKSTSSNVDNSLKASDANNNCADVFKSQKEQPK